MPVLGTVRAGERAGPDGCHSLLWTHYFAVLRRQLKEAEREFVLGLAPRP